MRTDITVGSTFPDYELPDHTNTLRRLSFLQGNDPMVLTLNRGAFCPKDRQHLQQLIPFSRQCAVGFTRLVTITAESLLREVTRQIRTDWKIDTPQMRSQWEHGDKKDFFPYGKSMQTVLARMANTVDRFE